MSGEVIVAQPETEIKISPAASKVDDRPATIVPDAHVLRLITARLYRDRRWLEASRSQSYHADHGQHAHEGDGQGSGKKCNERQNCDAGSRDEECTYALHGPNLSVLTNVGLPCVACKRNHTVSLLANVTKG